MNKAVGRSIRADLLSERPFVTINFNLGFDDYYLIEKNVDIDTLTLQYEEVQRVKWATKDEILKMIHNGSFIPYYCSLIEMLFDMRKRRGAHLA